MDAEIQEQGRELPEVLHLFQQATTSPLSCSVLQTPSQKSSLLKVARKKAIGQQDEVRRSPRINVKDSKDKSILKLAQDLVAKKVWHPGGGCNPRRHDSSIIH
jgi:hypothetical protein